MHIILGILAAVIAVAFLLYRIYIAVQIGRGVARSASKAGQYVRRRRLLGRNRKAFEQVEDPRTAAAAILASIVEAGRALTKEQESHATAAMKDSFVVDRQQAENFLSEGRWLARDAANTIALVNRLGPVIVEKTTPDERRAFVALVEDTLGIGGPPTDLQTDALGVLRQRLQLVN